MIELGSFCVCVLAGRVNSQNVLPAPRSKEGRGSLLCVGKPLKMAEGMGCGVKAALAVRWWRGRLSGVVSVGAEGMGGGMKGGVGSEMVCSRRHDGGKKKKKKRKGGGIVLKGKGRKKGGKKRKKKGACGVGRTVGCRKK